MVRVPNSWLKGPRFKSLREWQENFLLQGQLSVVTLISVSIPPSCYHSIKDLGHCAKSAGGRLQLNTHARYMWFCMKRHGAWLYDVHRMRWDGSSFMWHQPCQRCKYTTLVDIKTLKNTIKASHLCRITCECSESAREWRIAVYKNDRHQQQIERLEYTSISKWNYCLKECTELMQYVDQKLEE